jgi:hypothetical protein
VVANVPTEESGFGAIGQGAMMASIHTIPVFESTSGSVPPRSIRAIGEDG